MSAEITTYGDLQGWTCQDCGRVYVVSVTATAHHGPCEDCGSHRFALTPHRWVAPPEEKKE